MVSVFLYVSWGPTPTTCHRSPLARGADSWRLSAQSTFGRRRRPHRPPLASRLAAV